MTVSHAAEFARLFGGIPYNLVTYHRTGLIPSQYPFA
jgi:hypothetical protein